MEVLVPIAFFAFLGAVIVGPIWLRERTRQSAHRLVQDALEKGQPLDPAIVKQLTDGRERAKPDRARNTLGSGVVLLALAGGFAGASFLMGGFDPSGHAERGMLVPAIILGALGVAFLVLAIVDYSTKKKEE
ncbi:MAG: hypothetical protein JNM59_15045 [Hyphomonadaceae bacterium]|nr:hypothetical protein [Hyphomonadaceae bacterium]